MGQVDREPFLEAIVDYLRATNGSAVTRGAEARFYEAKQRLLEAHQSGSSDVPAIASIGWDDVRQRLKNAAQDV